MWVLCGAKPHVKLTQAASSQARTHGYRRDQCSPVPSLTVSLEPRYANDTSGVSYFLRLGFMFKRSQAGPVGFPASPPSNFKSTAWKFGFQAYGARFHSRDSRTSQDPSEYRVPGGADAGTGARHPEP